MSNNIGQQKDQDSNPYVKLGNLNEMLRTLVRNLNEVDENCEFIQSIIDIYRKSFIMQLLSDKYVIAVTGTQGVGKTTFMKHLYNIEETALMANQGVGERLPILFTETKNSPMKAYIHQIVKTNNQIEVIKKEISRDKVAERSHDYKVAKDLFLELEVQEAIFNNDRQHFLLLPGIESDEDYMRELTWSALRTAANYVFVMTANTYANQESHLLIKQLNSEFKHAQPIFVLSWADKSIDGNMSFKKLVKTDLRIEEDDRVIISGTNVEYEKDRLKQFKFVVNKYSSLKPKTNIIRAKNMMELLNRIDELRKPIKVFLEKLKTNFDYEEVKKEKYLAPFFKSQLDAKVEIQKYFNDFMDEFEQRMRNASQRMIENTSWLEELWKKLAYRDITLLREFQDLVKSAYHEATDNKFIQNKFAEALAKTQMGFLYSGQKVELEDPNNTILNMVTITHSDITINQLNQQVIENIKALYKDSSTDTSPMMNDQFEKSMKIIPHVFNELLRISFLMPKLIDSDYDEKHSIVKMDDNQTKKIFEIYKDTKPTLSQLMGSVVGLDMAIDGQLDLFNLLDKILPETAGSLVTAITSYLGIALIVINAASYLDNLVNRTQIRKLEIANMVSSDMRRYIEAQYLKNYDKVTEVFREYTIEAFRDKLGLSKKISVFWNVDQALIAIKKIAFEIKESLYVIPS